MKRSLWSFLLGVPALAVLGAAVVLWSPLPAHPDPAPYLAKAQAYEVEIIRDRWGIPHIFGKADADAAFGLGYAQAEDDFETVQIVAAATRGVLARYQGASAAPADYLAALLGIWDTVNEGYADRLPPEARAIAEAYADGLNLYAAEHLDRAWRGLLPFTGKDIVAGFVFKTPFFYGLDKQLTKLLTGTEDRAIALDPDGARRAFHLHRKTLVEMGSNAMAVAPHRSTDGKTRLVINSHQPYEGPVAWYEAHLKSGEGLDVYGGTFPGAPVILHGFNRHLGWANTVNKPDLADFYVLTRNPDNPKQYRLDGKWVEFEAKPVKLTVKLFGPFAWTVKRTILRSAHGPVLETDRGTYAVRYAGIDEIRHLEQYRRLNRAADYDEWLAAMRLNAQPSVNYVYADETGRIVYIYNGQYPDRKEGWDWSKDLPGDRSDLIWQGYREFDAVPVLADPSSGFLYNANNTPFSATDGPDNLKPEDFPASMGLETHETNRSLRIAELAVAAGPISAADLRRIKFDKSYSTRSKAARVVKSVLDRDWSGRPDLADALEHLRGWDLSTDLGNRHAALGILTTLETVTASFTGIAPGDPAKAFERAVTLLKANHGRIDPEWGAVNRIVRGDVNLPVAGGPDILRAVYPVKIREDGTLHATAGDTWICFVEWDAKGAVSAQAIHQFGSATLDAASRHYADQTPLFAEERLRPVVLDKDALIAEATARYRPGARDR